MKKILKNGLKILIFFIFVIGICVLIPVSSKAEQIVAQKGDLRCSLDSGNSCREEIVNGKVQKVTLTQTTPDGVVIEKIVSKTDTTGTFNVKFHVKGKVDMMPKADVFFVLDASRSMLEHYRGVYSKVQELTSRDMSYNISGFDVKLNSLYENGYLKVGFASFAGNDVYNDAFQLVLDNYVSDAGDLKAFKNVLGNKIKDGGTSKSQLPLASRNLANNDLSNVPGRDNCLYRVNNVCQWWYKKDKNQIAFVNSENEALKILKREKCEGHCGMVSFVGSPLYIGLQSAWDQYKNSQNLEHSYIIVLGDGGYRDKEYANSKDLIDNLNKKKIKIYAVNYAANECEYGEKNKAGKYTKCSENIMKSFSSYDEEGEKYYKKIQLDTEAIGKAFTEIITDILSSSLVGVTVSDQIGEDFAGDPIEFSINSIGDIDAYSEERQISIENDVETGWHKTNKVFEVVYTFNGNNKKNTYGNELQPEVYWIKEKGWESCSDTASSSGVSTLSYGDIIVRNCEQSLINDPRGGSIPGIQATLETNKLPIGTKSFGINNYIGVPSSIQIKSALICSYTFDYNRYEETRNALINVANDSKKEEQERVNAKQELNKLAKIADTIATDLSDTAVSFRDYDRGWPYPVPVRNYENQLRNELSGTLVLKYWSLPTVIDEYHYKKTNEEYYLHTYNNDGSKITWESGGEINISYYDNPELTNLVTIKKTVYNNVNALLISTINMELEEGCLDPKTGESSMCDNNKISGGSNFYVRRNEKSGGFVSVTLKNATFSGADIKLEGDKKSKNDTYDCTFGVSSSKPIYRQIELADPFVQLRTNNQRKIGNNWFNQDRHYNFTGIIKDNLWSNNDDYMYKYQMSKVNIAEINRNTSEEGVSSYLGRNCIFNQNNDYVCDFIRPQSSENGNSIYFYNMDVK